jgi:hypothetical protein
LASEILLLKDTPDRTPELKQLARGGAWSVCRKVEGAKEI